MATPRRAWFRAPDDLGHADLEDKLLASIWRLSALMNTRWARGGLTSEEASWVELSRGQMLHVTRTKQIGKARETLTVLSRICQLSVDFVGDSARIFWPKYAEFQGWRTRDLPESAYAPASAPAKEKEHPPSEGESARPSGPAVEGFVSMLKGEIPRGLNGETWASREAWFDHHREILIGEAQKSSRELDGPAFQGAFRSTLMRYWNHKRPKPSRRNGPVKTTGVSSVWKNG